MRSRKSGKKEKEERGGRSHTPDAARISPVAFGDIGERVSEGAEFVREHVNAVGDRVTESAEYVRGHVNAVFATLRGQEEDFVARFGTDLRTWASVDTRELRLRFREIFAVGLIFLLLPMSFFFSVFLFSVGVKLSYDSGEIHWFLLLFLTYFAYGYLDKTPRRGSRPIESFRSCFFWRWFRDYFPVELRKQNPHTKFSPEHKYLFGYHPHGVISVGVVCSFATIPPNFGDVLGNLQVRPATLSVNFKVPFFRELLIHMGVISVSAKSINHVLSRGPGNGVLVVPGGAAESLYAQPGVHDMVLKRRVGFFRIALEHGAHVVPIYSFGENDLYDVRHNSMVRKLQQALLHRLGYTVPLFSGTGYMCAAALPFNPIPHRHPVITVVGDPIPVEKTANPTPEDIAKLRERYIHGLKKIFEQFADTYDPKRHGDFRIVE
eukprot:TRINITY_DN40801_c0_g1_i1.p1 TRINITY_DN40801_c0_g1~~TRINITY_DN40801_c0_g1_i1.p1  ORF type:complete len:435 (+),score=131.47 TRINITY_DN40801_c0_g1_i1:65-1369(+)